MKERTMPGARWRMLIAVLGVLSMAPTAGDVGGCGAEVTALDPGAFASARKRMDCERCGECRIASARCQSACDASRPPETAIPATCRPLSHDGTVCLRALKAASCETYESYVADVAPSIPGECEFCKIPPEGASPAFTVDASTSDGAP